MYVGAALSEWFEHRLFHAGNPRFKSDERSWSLWRIVTVGSGFRGHSVHLKYHSNTSPTTNYRYSDQAFD